MDKEEMLEQTNETENVELQTTEEIEEVAKNTVEIAENDAEDTEATDKKSFKDLLKENPEYQQELNDMMKDRLKKQKSKIERDYTEKYGRLETVVNVGLGTSDVEEATKKLTDFYKKKGINIPDAPRYSERDIEVLANAEAEDIISDGYDEIVTEVERLAEIGVDNMTPRDKIVFTKLATERQKLEDEKSLASIGVSRNAINDAEFKNFAEKLNPSLSLKEKYEMYLEMKPKKNIEKIGSMKSGQANKVKEYYTAEEIMRMTDEELEDPRVWEAVRKSMTGQS